jgi:hypothetical protein
VCSVHGDGAAAAACPSGGGAHGARHGHRAPGGASAPGRRAGVGRPAQGDGSTGVRSAQGSAWLPALLVAGCVHRPWRMASGRPGAQSPHAVALRKGPERGLSRWAKPLGLCAAPLGVQALRKCPSYWNSGEIHTPKTAAIWIDEPTKPHQKGWWLLILGQPPSTTLAVSEALSSKIKGLFGQGVKAKPLMCNPFRLNCQSSTRSLSEKAPIEEARVAVGQMKGDNVSSLFGSLLSRRHAELNDERAPEENVAALGAPALPAGSAAP